VNDDLVDRALLEERRIEPSADFAGRVMLAVRLQADGGGGIEFPWSRLVPGLAACVILAVLGVVAISLRGTPSPDLAETMNSPLESAGLAAASAWVSMILSGSYALVWGARRVAGSRR
jgi:hypothetical protein